MLLMEHGKSITGKYYNAGTTSVFTYRYRRINKPANPDEGHGFWE